MDKGLKAVIVIAFLTVTAASALIIDTGKVSEGGIRVYCEDGGGVLPVTVEASISEDNITINVSYVNSVHRTPEYAIYKANGSGVYLYEFWFKQPGAGNPSAAGDISTGYIDEEDGFMVLREINRWVGYELRIPTSNYLNLTVTIGDYTITGEECNGILGVKVLGGLP